MCARMLLINVYVLKCVQQWSHSQWIRKGMIGDQLLWLITLLNGTFHFRIMNFLSMSGATFVYMLEKLNATGRILRTLCKCVCRFPSCPLLPKQCTACFPSYKLSFENGMTMFSLEWTLNTWKEQGRKNLADFGIITPHASLWYLPRQQSMSS